LGGGGFAAGPEEEDVSLWVLIVFLLSGGIGLSAGEIIAPILATVKRPGKLLQGELGNSKPRAL
jgi:hypothetical protein